MNKGDDPNQYAAFKVIPDHNGIDGNEEVRGKHFEGMLDEG